MRGWKGPGGRREEGVETSLREDMPPDKALGWGTCKRGDTRRAAGYHASPVRQGNGNRGRRGLAPGAVQTALGERVEGSGSVDEPARSRKGQGPKTSSRHGPARPGTQYGIAPTPSRHAWGPRRGEGLDRTRGHGKAGQGAWGGCPPAMGGKEGPDRGARVRPGRPRGRCGPPRRRCKGRGPGGWAGACAGPRPRSPPRS